MLLSARKARIPAQMKQRLKEIRSERGESKDRGVPKDYESALGAYDDLKIKTNDRYEKKLRFQSLEGAKLRSTSRLQQSGFPDLSINNS